MDAIEEADEEYEEEDQDFLLTPTKHGCNACGDTIHLGEEIFQVRVVQAVIEGEQVKYYDLLLDNYEPAHEPLYFSFECWELLEEEVMETVEDTPPMQDALALMECDICGSDIRELETFALVLFGEIHSSNRSPDKRHNTTFENMGKDKHICLACVYTAEQHLWEEEIEPVPGNPVCWEGMHSRCWRAGCNRSKCPYGNTE